MFAGSEQSWSLDLVPSFNFTRVMSLYVKTITVDNLALGPSAHGLDLGLKRSTFTLGLGVRRSTLVWVLNGLGKVVWYWFGL